MKLSFWRVFMKLLKGWFPEEYHSTGTDWKAIWRISCPLSRIPERSSQRTKIWWIFSVERGAFISRNGVLAIFLLVNGREMTLLVDLVPEFPWRAQQQESYAPWKKWMREMTASKNVKVCVWRDCGTIMRTGKSKVIITINSHKCIALL